MVWRSSGGEIRKKRGGRHRPVPAFLLRISTEFGPRRNQGGWAIARQRTTIEHIIDKVHQVGNIDKLAGVTIDIGFFQARWGQSILEEESNEINQVGDVD